MGWPPIIKVTAKSSGVQHIKQKALPTKAGRACCLLAYILYFFRPGHHLLKQFRMDLEIHVGQLLEQVDQISVWLQAIGLSCKSGAAVPAGISRETEPTWTTIFPQECCCSFRICSSIPEPSDVLCVEFHPKQNHLQR